MMMEAIEEHPGGNWSTLIRIARHEWRILSADRSLAILAAVFVAAVAVGSYNGVALVRFQQATLRAVAEDDRARMEQLESDIAIFESTGTLPKRGTNPRDPTQVSYSAGQPHAAIPPAPLAAVTIGQSDLNAYYFRINPRSRQSFLGAAEIENPTILALGHFDLGFVLVFVYPLLIIALSYDLLSSERERGTLILIRSQPIRMSTVVLGKVLARAAAIFGLTLALLPLAWFLAVRPAEPGLAARLLLWWAAVVLYGAFWFAVALAVNSLGRSSSTNAIALASVWLALAVMAPALMGVAASTLYPVPSRLELNESMNDASKEAAERGGELRERYYHDHPEIEAPKAGGEDFAVRFQAVRDAVERSLEPILTRFDGQLARQQALVDRVRFLSPSVAAQQTLSQIAGTDVSRYRHAIEQVREFHEAWRTFFVSKVLKREKLVSADYARIPRFHFREESIASVAARALSSLIGFAVPAAVIGLIGLARVRRYSAVA